ncbi:hypothetical protein AAC387_Pa12g0586 [Persea americana]
MEVSTLSTREAGHPRQRICIGILSNGWQHKKRKSKRITTNGKTKNGLEHKLRETGNFQNRLWFWRFRWFSFSINENKDIESKRGFISFLTRFLFGCDRAFE